MGRPEDGTMSDISEATGVDRRTMIKGAAGLGAATAFASVITSSHTASAAVGIGGSLDGIGTFEVLSVSWGASAVVSQSGGGAGAGKVNLSDINFTKFTDETSPNILEHLLGGLHVPAGSITISPANRNSPSITYAIEDVIFTSYQSSGSGGDDRLTESITMTFRELTYTVGTVSVRAVG
jgi:type VI protein secretion system component Hcp